MRLFTAISLPEEITEETEKLTYGIPGIRWNNPHTRHITLKFIGECSIEKSSQALSTVHFKSFSLRVESAGIFRNKAGLILWAGISENDEIKELYRKIENALSGIGVRKDKRQYFPHITLARVRNTGESRLQSWIENFRDFSTPFFQVKEFALFNSVLKPEGAVHHMIETYPGDVTV